MELAAALALICRTLAVYRRDVVTRPGMGCLFPGAAVANVMASG